jgi:hypothetical protein
VGHAGNHVVSCSLRGAVRDSGVGFSAPSDDTYMVSPDPAATIVGAAATLVR